ncbi:MAG TPA: VOC family protein [Candidatus Nanoarchaeia archaeon]|nr:VOC family protein [Candidatus Nanoarchaeia archaeon]
MNFNALIPELRAFDFAKSLKFYTEVLGFKLEYERKESKFAFLSLEGTQIMIEQSTPEWNTGKIDYPYGRGIHLQITVKSIEKLLDSLNKLDYPLYVEPFEREYKVKNKLIQLRQFLVKDPDGYLLRFVENLGQNNSF